MGEKFTKSNFLNLSQEVLEFQLKSLYPLRVKRDSSRINLIFINHDRNFSTFLSVLYLAEHERVADVYTLSRSLFESVISMGILVKQLIPHDLDRYQDYQFTEIHKTYSHLKRLGLEYLSGVKPAEASFVKRKSDEYIANYGRKLSTWTGRSVLENVKMLDQNLPPTCKEKHFYEYLYCQIYRRGSPATHSSFGGLSKSVEIETVKIPGDFAARRFKADLQHLVFSCYHSLIAFLSSVRFMGFATEKPETEEYFHKISRYIIAEN
jgi:hypothetical protein